MSCWCDGDPNAPILIVGMAPGREELKEGRPFVGGSGRLLWGQLQKIGITRPTCYIVNTIGEWPLGSGGGPTKAQLDSWWERVDEAILRSKAKVMLLLGGDALKRMTGLVGGIESWRGYLVKPEDCQNLERMVEVEGVYKTNTKKHKKGDRKISKARVVARPAIPPTVEWIIPTLHPAGIMRSGLVSLPAFRADLLRLKRAVDGELEISDDHYQQVSVDILTHGPVAFDIETPMDSWAIERIGISTPEITWTAPWDSTAFHVTRRMLARPETLKVAQNLSFDYPRLEAAGVEINGPLWDTMLSGQLLQPDLPKSLNYLISLYLDTSRHKHLSEGNPAFYNAMDALRTRELQVVHKEALQLQGSLRLFEDIIMPAIPPLIRMTKRGIKVDEGRREEWLKELDVKVESLTEEWFGKTGVNPNSPKQIADFLYGKLGLPTQYNKYGGVSTDASALMQLRKECPTQQPMLDLLGELKRANKLRSTYARSPIGDDGFVHPQYLPANKDFDGKTTEGEASFTKGMAGTGRLAASNPNIANQPPEARRIFIPSRPDLELVEFDYSQIELRVAAALSGDRVLQDALEGDVHARTQELLKCDRVRAKNLMYGCVTMDTQALTLDGWKTYDELKIGDRILSYDPIGNYTLFLPIQELVYYESAPVIEMKANKWCTKTTPNHRWYGFRRTGRGPTRRCVREEFTTADITTEHNIITSAPCFNSIEETPVGGWTKQDTDWTSWLLRGTPAQRDAWLAGMVVGDGYQFKHGNHAVVQNQGKFCEAIKVAATLCGHQVRVEVHSAGVSHVRMLKKTHVTGQKLTKQYIGEHPVWCPKVNTGFWVMRQGETITITGNTIYGAGPRKLSMVLKTKGYDISEKECKELQTALANAYPKLFSWRATIVAEVGSRYKLQNPFGRVRYFIQGSKDAPAALDFLPQSTAADILWSVIPSLEAAALSLGGAILTTVHDSVLLEVPIGCDLKMIKEILEQPFNCVSPGFFVPTNLKRGRNWGEMREEEK